MKFRIPSDAGLSIDDANARTDVGFITVNKVASSITISDVTGTKPLIREVYLVR